MSNILIGRWDEAKDPSDSGVWYEIDIRTIVADANSIVTACTWAAAPTTTPPLTILESTITPQGRLRFRPGGGLAGTDYVVTATATLANGNVIQRSGVLPVRER